MDRLPFDLLYRPLRFADVLGNEGPRKSLAIMARSGTLTQQSYLFSGTKGCGKTTLARITARAVVCDSLQDGEPCNECGPCRAVIDDVSPSVEEIDAGSQGTVDKARAIVQGSNYAPSDGSPLFVHIIDEAQRLSPAAQDAFLKVIESRAILVIMCTTEPQKIRGPIRNRLWEYPIRPPSEADVAALLARACSDHKIEAEEAALRVIVQRNGCVPRSSLISLDTLSQLGPIRIADVRKFFRFDSYESVDLLLSTLDEDPARSMGILDSLFDSESPSWVRDAIVLAISSGLRADIGAKSNYPVPLRFFQSRLHGWSTLAAELGRLDKPRAADIEAVLLGSLSRAVRVPPPVQASSGPSAAASPSASPDLPVPSASPSPSPQPSPPPSRSPEPAPPPVPGKDKREISVDGVRFTPHESLTSLDGKISGPPASQAASDDGPAASVGLDKARVPINEKEFADIFRGS